MVPALTLAITTFLGRSGASSDPAVLTTAIAGVGMVASLALALAVARTITRPLRRLGEAAERASNLQTLVEALRRPSGGGQALALTPVGLPPEGEIGGVAKAFDALQGAAARLAVGQATLLNKTVADKGTIEVFVNLARRMQGLVDHQIEFLDGLEAEEQDPDTLENLFRLDQLATRVRRNAESLLTLAGSTSSRSWERPLALSDVIRAGIAEVEDIGRVDLMTADNAAMLGNVAADAAHLLSELLENATHWSPPDTRVEVTGAPTAGGYAITIEDRGIGMPVDALAEANHILTGPPLAEATVARSLGLVVAGRLARRLGIVVTLSPAASGGVVATVLVPPNLMVVVDDVMGLEEMAAGAARTLPFALARQEKRARISSQRARPRGTENGERGEATITPLPYAGRIELPDVPTPATPGWPAAESTWFPAEPVWSPTEPAWSPAEGMSPADAGAVAMGAQGVPVDEPGWPAGTVADGPAHLLDDAEASGWLDALRDDADPYTGPVVTPAPPAPAAAEPSTPASAAAEEAATTSPGVEPLPPPVKVSPPPAPEPPPDIRPIPAVRPARFAAASSLPLAGSLPTRVPAVEAKQDEYRKHLERATAAGLVRRVPKASLPQDTGGRAKRAQPAGGDQPAPERLPDEVRSLLSSYRSGVQRGRTDDPSDEQRTTSPQEQP